METDFHHCFKRILINSKFSGRGRWLEYRYVTEHLRGDITRERMFDALKAAIHQFAKRQDTWFRRLERQGIEIHWLDGSNAPEVHAKTIAHRFDQLR